MPYHSPNQIPISRRAPEPRPRCPECHKPLVAEYAMLDEHGETCFSPRAQFGRVPVTRVFVRWKSYGHFCSLRCGTMWANRARSDHMALQGETIPLDIRGKWGA